MKVAIVVNKFPAISETFVINHVVSLIESGIDVTVFSLAQPTQTQSLHPQFVAHKLNKHVVYGEPIPLNKGRRFLRFLHLLYGCLFHQKRLKVLGLLNFLKYGKSAVDLSLFFHAQLFSSNNQFDIIHCHFGPIGNIVQKIKQAGLLRGKIVVSFHGYDFLRKDVLIENNNYRDLFTNSDGIVANSTFTYHELVKLGCNKNKLVIIPVLPSNQVFALNNNNADKSKIDDFKVLTIARLVEKKGIRYAIEAIYLLKTNYKIAAQYTIIGSGALLQELQQMVAQYELTNEVHFLGAQSQDRIAEGLAQTDVFLLPSIVDANGDTETQGLVLIEAQLMEVPIVSTRVGGIPDSIAEHRSGILVDEKNAAQLAHALFSLYTDKDLQHRMGKEGKKFVMDNFNPAFLTQKTIRFYESLIADK